MIISVTSHQPPSTIINGTINNPQARLVLSLLDHQSWGPNNQASNINQSTSSTEPLVPAAKQLFGVQKRWRGTWQFVAFGTPQTRRKFVRRKLDTQFGDSGHQDPMRWLCANPGVCTYAYYVYTKSKGIDNAPLYIKNVQYILVSMHMHMQSCKQYQTVHNNHQHLYIYNYQPVTLLGTPQKNLWNLCSQLLASHSGLSQGAPYPYFSGWIILLSIISWGDGDMLTNVNDGWRWIISWRISTYQSKNLVVGHKTLETYSLYSFRNPSLTIKPPLHY